MIQSAFDRSGVGWIRTHWKVAIAIWLGLSLSGGVVGFVCLHNSVAAQISITKAESNPGLIELLGSPLKTGWFISGSISVSPGAGHAELSIPIAGSRGKGTIYSEAHRQAGIWHLTLLQYGANGSDERLDLLADPMPKPHD